MAMTDLLLVWLGSFAILATYGVFYEFRDRWTQLLVEFGAAILWGFFALSAMDVVVSTNTTPPVSEPQYPMVYLGAIFAVTVFLYAIYDLVTGAADEAREADIEGVGGVR